MTMTLNAGPNINSVWGQFCNNFISHPFLVEETSRAGKVIRYPGPVITTYWNPRDRVLFCADRDANPFFHLMEGLWMIAGRNDLEWPLMFNSRFHEFSDDGEILNGAYGHRWREHFGYDQLAEAVRHLKAYPNSRRCVITMYDAFHDTRLQERTKDHPCNTQIYLQILQGKLEMTVCCRSNDAVWGCYGANAVHFSMLMEYLAAELGVPLGYYVQFSNNFHVYDRHWDLIEKVIEPPDLYEVGATKSVPMITVKPQIWLKDLYDFFEHPLTGKSQDVFFDHVARPMYRAWHLRKDGAPVEDVAAECKRIQAPDWRVACVAWLDRRYNVELNDKPEEDSPVH